MYRLSNSLPYLLARVGIRMGELFVRVVRKEGLTLPMYRVLAALAEQDRPLRLVELSALTSADLSTLSRLIADMHKAGFVSRERPANDQRSLQVELTSAGQELYDRFMPVAAYYEDVATGSLSRKDAAALKATLNLLYDNLDRLEAEVEGGDVAKLIQPKQERPPKERPTAKGRPPK
ncbi:MarR family winged helix-turn-helix transcriptional regulator [Bradyrhizobium tunisiense]|uniref:MarR family winged helix-turn-helix transcriptional regulator n=1 Tax=Bradyrhizobium tunisiense TaxID=3278709 RepID=UPI0035E334EC